MKVFLSLFLLTTHLWAAQISEFNYDGVSSHSEPLKAKKEILRSASQEISKKLITELIGAEKFALQKNVIDRKILKNSNKYILYVKGGNLKPSAHGHAMTVTMKVSVKSLKTLLLKEGLLFKAEGEGRVLPLISFVNQISGQSFRWWAEDKAKNPMAPFSVDFNKELRRKFFDKGFYSFKPGVFGFVHTLESSLRRASLKKSQQLELAKNMGANMLIHGDIQWMKEGGVSRQFRIKVKLQVIHTSNGRVIAEVVRNYKTGSGPAMQALPQKFEEIKSGLASSLVSQVYESWEKGSLGTQRVRLVLKGDLSFSQVSALRKLIQSKVSGVRSVKHRGYQVGRVTLEMDSSSSSRQIADVLAQQKFSGHSLAVKSVTSSEIRVDVQ